MKWWFILAVVLGAGLGLLANADLAYAGRKSVREVPYDEGMMPAALVQAALDSVNLPLPQRMKAISEPLMGLGYGLDENGEGIAPDEDPPARYDIFDCVTFLEEILALTFSADPLNAPQLRNALRYKDSEVSYETRNHMWLQQWIPNNIEAGFVRDVTSQVGQTHVVEKNVSVKTWARWAGTKNFQMDHDLLPIGAYSLPVLSLDAAVKNIERIPEGAILVVVRKPRSYSPIIVRHVGFVLPRAGGPTMMRHASKLGKRVRDHDLRWYLNNMRWFDKVPIEGIHVLMPLEQGPRQARLPND